jgi:hypothetical protein
MIKMKKLFCLFISIVLFTNLSFGQDNSNVTITACGQGETQSDAQQDALRSAIEQAFGTFISAKTEILNDELVSDQITSVSNGNIQSFEILSESELPNGKWSTTLKAVVSVEKLTSFVQSKGVTVEIKGGLFAANIKQQMLNEQGEIEAVYNMVGVLHELMQTAIDFSMITENPKSLDSDGENWEIPIKIQAHVNKNFEICINFIKKNLKVLSMSEEEVANYKLSNKKYFSVPLVYPQKVTLISGEDTYQEGKQSFTLRKQKSLDILCAFFEFWPFYLSNFTISSDLGLIELNKNSMNEPSLNGKPRGKDDFIYYKKIVNSDGVVIPAMTLNFRSGTLITNFYISEKKTLAEIEKISSYSIKSNGIVSKFTNGGATIYNEGFDESFAVTMAIINLKWGSNKEAKEQIEQLNLNGFNDWRFPTLDEANYIEKNRMTLKNYFWIYNYDAEKMEFSNNLGPDVWKGGVIAVRDFSE